MSARVIRNADPVGVEGAHFSASVHENGVVLAVEIGFYRRRSVIDPDNLVDEIIGAEDFIQQNLGKMHRAPIQMQVQSPVRGQQIPHPDQPRIQHGKVLLDRIPGIRIPLSETPGFRLAGVFAAADPAGEPLAGGERRIAVDQAEFAAQLLQQGIHHSEIIAEDQAVEGRGLLLETGTGGINFHAPVKRGGKRRRNGGFAIPFQADGRRFSFADGHGGPILFRKSRPATLPAAPQSPTA